MKTFVVDPLVGVGAIRLGASRASVIAVLGEPEESFVQTPDSHQPTDAWFDSGFQVFYEGDEPIVSFIELSRDCGFQATLFGTSVFSTKASQLVADIGRRASIDKNDPELGFSYTFPSLELAFWRPDDNDDDEPYFSTVGIGVPGYFDKT